MSIELEKSITTSQVAYFAGVTVRSVQAWRAQSEYPLLPIATGTGGTESRYDLRTVCEWMEARTRRRIGITDEQIAYDYQLERARLTAEQADGQALANAVKRKEQAPIEILTWALARLGDVISGKLAALPGQLKKRLPELGQTELMIIRREIAAAQNIAATARIDWDEYGTDPGTALDD